MCQKLEQHGKDGEDYDKDDREGLPEAKTVICFTIKTLPETKKVIKQTFI